MRKKDREITDITEITCILSEGRTAQVAFADNGEPYIVTMNYGYSYSTEGLKLYFHSAQEGRKIDCIRRNPYVCFTIAICDSLIHAEKACDYGLKYRSVVGYGKIRIVTEEEEKIKGLNLLMKQQSGSDEWIYDNDILNITAVICIDVTNITGKKKV